MKLVPVGKSDFAMVDDDDYDTLSKFKWGLRTKGQNKYAQTWSSERQRCIMMHRMIMRPQKTQMVDHIDRNGLNNQKTNLRVCTHEQNMRNAVFPKRNGFKNSTYKGVTRNHKNWKARISVCGEQVYIGTFRTEEAAARAYDKYASRVSGSFARLNFPSQN